MPTLAPRSAAAEDARECPEICAQRADALDNHVVDLAEVRAHTLAEPDRCPPLDGAMILRWLPAEDHSAIVELDEVLFDDERAEPSQQVAPAAVEPNGSGRFARLHPAVVGDRRLTDEGLALYAYARAHVRWNLMAEHLAAKGIANRGAFDRGVASIVATGWLDRSQPRGERAKFEKVVDHWSDPRPADGGAVVLVPLSDFGHGMSLKVVGVLVWLRGHPGAWAREVSERFDIGIDTAQKRINTLIEVGLVKRVTRREGGRVSGVVYYVSGTAPATASGKSASGFAKPRNSTLGKPTSGEAARGEAANGKRARGGTARGKVPHLLKVSPTNDDLERKISKAQKLSPHTQTPAPRPRAARDEADRVCVEIPGLLPEPARVTEAQPDPREARPDEKDLGNHLFESEREIRHPSFTISLEALTMQLVTANLGLSTIEARDVARKTALANGTQWAAEIANGKLSRDVLPYNIPSALRGSVVKQRQKQREQRAGGQAGVGNVPAYMRR